MISAIQIPPFVQRNLIFLPRILCYVLVVLIGISSAQLVWGLIGNSSVEQSQNQINIPATPPKLVAPPPPRPDYGHQVARLHLMGKAVAVNQAQLQLEEDAPDTSLNLTLSGVLALGRGDGYAIIEDQARKHKFYQIDDEVISGVTLNSVYSDYVILNRSGRNEKLSLPRATAKGLENINRNTNSQKQSALPPVTKQTPQQQAYAEFGVEPEDDDSLLVDIEDLLEDPTSLPDYVSISASSDANGAFQGYRVEPADTEGATLFYDLGLMDGDIVVSINDVKLDNPNKASQALEKLVSSNSIELTVLRAGTPITVVHNLE
ncbi:MAG: type II secretion system protein GspC [Pseudomonadota bacterium]